MRVNFIGLPHVTHGSSVLSKRVQLGGGGVIFMVAHFASCESGSIISAVARGVASALFMRQRRRAQPGF
jgi:hypothetical protein